MTCSANTLGSRVAAISKYVAKAEAEWRSRCDAEGYVDPPERLVVARERIAEVARMLDALDSRFLRRR
jgi:hypothetical protein